jgi:hypothetical protein
MLKTCHLLLLEHHIGVAAPYAGASEPELHILHVMSHFHLIILFAPHKAPAAATQENQPTCDN